MARQWYGEVRTIRDAVRAELLIWVFCRWCGHAVRLDPRELAWAVGAASLEELERRFKCARCERREAIVLPSLHGWTARD